MSTSNYRTWRDCGTRDVHPSRRSITVCLKHLAWRSYTRAQEFHSPCATKAEILAVIVHKQKSVCCIRPNSGIEIRRAIICEISIRAP